MLEKVWKTYTHLSTGDIFRWLVSNDNAIGRYVVDQMNGGKLVNDHVTIHIFNAYFYTAYSENKGMLIDGYPRTLTQLDALMDTVKEHNRDLLWIYFKLSDEQSLTRMMARARKGEDEETMNIRLQEYYEKTFPIVEKFSEHGNLITIDASGSIEEIHEEVMKHIS